MSQVAVEKIDGKTNIESSFFDEMKGVMDTVRQRAFDIFQGRGANDGLAMDDWLTAERDLFRIPEAELVEQDGKFEARVSAPGFDPADIKVTATPESMIIRGKSTHKHDGQEGDVHFCEFGEKTLFRRIDLPEPINPAKVSADLEKGMLKLTAVKAKSAKQSQSIAA